MHDGRLTPRAVAPLKPDRRSREVTVKVQHATDMGAMFVTVASVGAPTVADVKAAVTEAMGTPASEVRLVVKVGGAFGTRPDDERVTTRRVFALGLDVLAAKA